MLERKAIPWEIKATADEGWSFDGYGSCFGNLDAGGDIVDPGFFADTLDFFLGKGIIALYHNWNRPIGKPTKADTDLVGLAISGKLSKVPDGDTARTLMLDKVIQSLSMGYQSTKRMWLDGPKDVEDYWRSIRYNPTPEDLEAAAYGARVLLKGKLYEVSPVPFPMNELCDITAAKSAEAPDARTFEAHSSHVLATCEEFIERVKGLAELRQAEGRALSPDRRATLKRLRDGFDALLTEAEPKAETADIDRLWMQFQETEARLLGVSV